MSSSALFAQEICDNGIDDDADGLIDLNDITDCSCNSSMSFALMPNGSFEAQSCCPNGISLTNCIQGWTQVTTPTTDYLHECDYMPSFVPMPLPDGDGCVGMFFVDGWQEYIGTCLSTPLPATVPASVVVKYAGLMVDGSVMGAVPWSVGPAEITVYGFTSCPMFPIVTTGCPLSSFGGVVLGSVTVLPGGAWQQAQINFTPTQPIEAIAIGSACSLPPIFQWTGGYGPYVLLDEIGIGTGSGSAVVTTDGSPCTSDLVLSGSPDLTAVGYQWYLNGVALVGETDTVLNATDLGLNNGVYQFLTQGPTDCSITTVGVADPLPPVVNMQTSLTSGCAPLLVNFGFSVTSGTMQVPHWDFGDGTSFIWAQPAHIFWEPGSYTVTMTATSLSGCITTDTLVIDVANCTSVAELNEGPRAAVRVDGDHLLIALEVGWSAEVMAELVAADGRIVRSRALTGHPQAGSTFDLSGLPAGVLVLRLTSAANGWTHRFVRL